MDYEGTVKVLADTKERLSDTQGKLADVTREFHDLKSRYESLSARYLSVRSEAIDCSWRYCLEKSRDFEYTPKLDTELLETQNRGECGRRI